MQTTSTQRRNNAIITAKKILNNPDDYAIVDTQTSGLVDAGGEVMEIAVIDPAGDTLLRDFRHPVNACSSGALAVHGLTPEKINASNPREWVDIWDDLYLAVNGKKLLAYNAPFDLGIIANTDRAEGIEESAVDPEDGSLCIMRLWSDFIGVSRWQKLEGGDHTALGDCEATLRLIQKMASADLMEEDDRPLAEIVNELAKIGKQQKP